MAVDCYSSFANHFRIAHDISLDNLSCFSEENNEPELELTSATLDASTKKDSPVNYLEHSFSVNIKNATNLLGIDIIKTPPTGALRIEDIEKLEQGINQLNNEEERTDRNNQDAPLRTQDIKVPDVADKSRCLTDTVSTDETYKKAPKRSEKEEEEEVEEDALHCEAERTSVSISEKGVSPPPSSGGTPKDATAQPGSLKRRRRPRKLPNIPTQAQRNPSSKSSSVPLAGLPNFQSLADEIRLADPNSHFNINLSESTQAWRYGISHKDPNGIDWRELGSPESIEPPHQLETDSEPFVHAFLSPKCLEDTAEGQKISPDHCFQLPIARNNLGLQTDNRLGSPEYEESNDWKEKAGSPSSSCERKALSPGKWESELPPGDLIRGHGDLAQRPEYKPQSTADYPYNIPPSTAIPGSAHKQSPVQPPPPCASYLSPACSDPPYSRGGEFCEAAVEYFEEDHSHGSSIVRQLDEKIDLNFNTTAGVNRACLSSSNHYLRGASSRDDGACVRRRPPGGHGRTGGDPGQSGLEPLSAASSLSDDLSDLEPSHRGCHKLIPRHPEEMFIEIGDPIYVEEECDDLWCEGINLRTGKQGIFPAAYATDLSLLDDGGPAKYMLRFLGSVEVSYHKGNDVLCQAIHKVAQSRRLTMNTQPPPMYCLEISEYGIKMTDRSKKRKRDKQSLDPPKNSTAAAIRARLAKILNKGKEQTVMSDHFFSLKNVSFCGFHPRNDKYFAFITKHPLEMRFACHVFLGNKSTRIIAEVIGESFRKFYQEYMAFVHPTEDIYLE